MSVLTESNRWKHLVLGIPEGFLLTLLFAMGTATGMEVKDCHYDKANTNKPIYKWTFRAWDWWDWFFTVLGGIIGQALQILVLYFIFR